MSSRKKSSKSNKKTNKKNVVGKGEELEDKLQQTTVEKRAMEDYVAQRKYLLMRSKADGEEWQKQVNLLKVDMETQKGDYKVISADMTRQYKLMETEMSVKVHILETKLAHYKQKLSETEAELLSIQKDTKLSLKGRDREMEILQQKNSLIQSSFEKVLHDALDSLVLKINRSRDRMEPGEMMIQAKNKKLLSEFGLNPRDI